MKYRCGLCLLLLLLVNLLGCGDGRPARVPFAGQVLIDGKPLTAGFVRVVPDNARPATGEIDSTGHFRLTTFEGDDGCVVGRHPIEIIARKSLNPTSIQWLTPIKYQDATTSGLTIEVTKPVEDYKIELSWNGEQPTIEQTFTAGDTPSPE